MFDTYLTAPREITRHTHVNMVDPSVEKGARFLDEVQKEAESRITKLVLADVPTIDAKLVLYEAERSFETMAVNQHVAFKINGKEFDIRVKGDGALGERPEDIIRRLADALTKEILRQINPSLLPLNRRL